MCLILKLLFLGRVVHISAIPKPNSTEKIYQMKTIKRVVNMKMKTPGFFFSLNTKQFFL